MDRTKGHFSILVVFCITLIHPASFGIQQVSYKRNHAVNIPYTSLSESNVKSRKYCLAKCLSLNNCKNVLVSPKKVGQHTQCIVVLLNDDDSTPSYLNNNGTYKSWTRKVGSASMAATTTTQVTTTDETTTTTKSTTTTTTEPTTTTEVTTMATGPSGCPITPLVCRPDFVQTSEGCFYLELRGGDHMLYWDDAEAFCQTFGCHVHLVGVETQAKSTMLDTLKEAAGGVKFAWTGARDLEQNNRFYMVGSGVEVPSGVWAPGHPDHNNGGADNDCTYTCQVDKLCTYRCNAVENYICEAYLN